jgi:AhpD family alkylhydroperoxidase
VFIEKELDALYQKFADRAYAPSLLDGKTKELIALACSVMADCVPCIEYHHAKVKENGASDAEVREALAITMTISAGSKQAKYWKLIHELSKGE